MTLKPATLFLVLLIAIPTVRAQSAPPEISAAQKKKARDEREQKTLALVDEIITESQSLRLPENRIRVDIALAGPLWSRDEKRARSLFKEAAASLREITAAIETADPEYRSNQTQLPQQLRQEMLQIAASHDARLAVDFLRATRPNSTPHPPNSGLTNLEAQLEMRVANQIADKDPSDALSVAEDSLKFALDYESLNLLYRLQTQQKALAERFLDDILTALRTYGIGNSPATPIALNLLRAWSENTRAARDPSAPRTTTALSLSNFDAGTARELANMILDALLNNAPARTVTAYGRTFIDGPSTMYPGQMNGVFQQLKPLLPDIETLVPDRVAALRTRSVEFEKSYEAQQGPWAKYQELVRTGTSEALMEAAKTAPSELVDNLVQQAAWKAINQGDDARAREIIGNIADPTQRANMESQAVRQSFYRAREQKNFTAARSLISRLQSVEEQANLLVQLASSSAIDGETTAAVQLLGEAAALLGDRASGYGQLQAQMRIAKAYEPLDAGKTSAIVEKVIDQINELAGAALVLSGFDIQQYFRAGEFVINGGNPINMITLEAAQELGSMSRSDYERAASMAGRFQRPEMRVMAKLQIVQAMLSAATN